MNRLLQTLTLGFVFVLGATAVASAAERPDPAIGTWTLNVDKSKFHDGTAPKSTTRTYSAGTAGTDMKVTGVAADGTAISQTATLNLRWQGLCDHGQPRVRYTCADEDQRYHGQIRVEKRRQGCGPQHAHYFGKGHGADRLDSVKDRQGRYDARHCSFRQAVS
jgi:hypothetical protein